MIELFNINENISILAQFKHRIDLLPTSNDFEKRRNNLIRLVINSMQNNPKQWDSSCQINIEWIGNSFIRTVSSDDIELNKEQLDDICSTCFRFLFELYLSTKNELTRELIEAKNFVFDNIDSFESRSREQIVFATREMPIAILKEVANSDAIDSLKNLEKISEKAERLIQNWETTLAEKEGKVNELKDSLQKYENAFNFVGLYQGFDDLAKEKQTERDGLLLWIRILSATIVIPIFAELFFVYAHIDEVSKIKDGLLLSALPTISLIAIAIYYFRVLLFNYKSVKSQLLQIDLRKTLCRFIQNYAEYSSNIKKKDGTSLEKFENIIFSGIVTEDGNLPSTFDGIEQLGKLIKSIK